MLVTQDGEPREDALVCAMSDEGTYDYDYTDSDGLVTFGVDTTEDLSLYLTVTGRNLIPYEGSIDVYEVGAPVDTGEPIPDDSSEPDTGEREQPPPGIAHGGACGCGGGLPAAGPFVFLLLPLWLRRRSRDAGRPA